MMREGRARRSAKSRPVFSRKAMIASGSSVTRDGAESNSARVSERGGVITDKSIELNRVGT
jgi:hypothetical protein